MANTIINTSQSFLARHDRQAEIVENTFFEHFLRFTPSQPFLLNYLIQGVLARVVRVQNQKLALTQLPRIVQTHDAVGVLSSSVHHRASHPLKMISQNFTVLNDVFTIRDMQNSTVVVGHFLDNPGNFSGTDPFSAVLELLVAAEVDSINDFLNICKGGHFGNSAMILEVKPREHGL